MLVLTDTNVSGWKVWLLIRNNSFRKGFKIDRLMALFDPLLCDVIIYFVAISVSFDFKCKSI